MTTTSRLSAMPLFLRRQNFWNGIFDPMNQDGVNANFNNLRISAATHKWGLDDKGFFHQGLKPLQIGLLDVAQSILERGIWTIPSWRMEQHIASLFEKHLKWSIQRVAPRTGELIFEAVNWKADGDFNQSLVTAKWQAEAESDAIDEKLEYHSASFGSDAERLFYKSVLAPVLVHPLLDYLQLQPLLSDMGLDPIEYANQRVDFAIDTNRGLHLVIELDGGQHHDPAQFALDKKRDASLRKNGWDIWRIQTSELPHTKKLQEELRAKLNSKGDLAPEMRTP